MIDPRAEEDKRLRLRQVHCARIECQARQLCQHLPVASKPEAGKRTTP